VDHDTVEQLRALLSALAGDDVRAARPSRHNAWRFSTLADLEGIDRPALASAVQTIAAQLEAVRAESGAWRAAIDAAPDPAGLTAVEAAMRLVRSGSMPSGPEWRELAQDGRAEALAEAVRRMRTAVDTIRALDPQAPAEILGRDLGPVLTAVRSAAGSFFLGRKGRLTSALGDLSGLSCFAGKVDPVPPLERLVAAADDHR
jgi:hypothetical protein